MGNHEKWDFKKKREVIKSWKSLKWAVKKKWKAKNKWDVIKSWKSSNVGSQEKVGSHE